MPYVMNYVYQFTKCLYLAKGDHYEKGSPEKGKQVHI